MQDLSYLGIRNVGQIHHNLSTPALYEEAVRRREGWISHLGPLVVRTGQYTGRSADDKFVVREPSSARWCALVTVPCVQALPRGGCYGRIARWVVRSAGGSLRIEPHLVARRRVWS